MSLLVVAPRVNVNSANPQFPYPPDDRLDPMIKEQLLEDVKSAMKARDKQRVNALRLVAAEIKRKEVDERRPVDDPAAIAILEKMMKQRKDSHGQYLAAGREELAAQEAFEMTLIQGYLPEPLSAEEVEALVEQVMKEMGADHISKMGQVMGTLKSQLAGRADMGPVGALVKARLST